MGVKLPNVMLPYACRRTLVCCRPPWRVWLRSSDEEQLHAFAASEGQPSQSVKEWVEPLGSGQLLLAQNGRSCCLLDDQAPACRLQRARGLQALPAQCRNFPRSVVLRPDGTEVGFQLDCPTAAALVCEAPERFALVDWPEQDWPYPAYTTAPDSLRLRNGDVLSLVELDRLRLSWWGRLGDVAGSALVDALEDLAGGSIWADEPRRPSEPRPSLPALLAVDVITALPARGDRYAVGRSALATALQQVRQRHLVAIATTRSASIACAASLCVQLAGLHDGRTVSAGLRAAGRLALYALELCAALASLELADEVDCLADGLTAAAHLVRLDAARGVLVG